MPYERPARPEPQYFKGGIQQPDGWHRFSLGNWEPMVQANRPGDKAFTIVNSLLAMEVLAPKVFAVYLPSFRDYQGILAQIQRRDTIKPNEMYLFVESMVRPADDELRLILATRGHVLAET